ncbi:MAG: 8-oxo-dGTP diphosphatase [Roseimicrobium sp.]
MQVDWPNWQPTIRATLMFIADGERVLLIRKKRGFGQGKINGPGGKLDPGETELACAVRETQEELAVTALNPQKRGELWFQFVDGLAMHVAVFHATAHEGEAIETEEAAPLWTPIHAIPFEQMWADDVHWLHRMLTAQESFLGKFLFEGDAMLWHEIAWY